MTSCLLPLDLEDCPIWGLLFVEPACGGTKLLQLQFGVCACIVRVSAHQDGSYEESQHVFSLRNKKSYL